MATLIVHFSIPRFPGTTLFPYTTLFRSPPLLFCLLFVWGGMASGVYPVALSMAGDQFRGTEPVTVNAAQIMGSEEATIELQSRRDLGCPLLLGKKKANDVNSKATRLTAQ